MGSGCALGALGSVGGVCARYVDTPLREAAIMRSVELMRETE